MLNTNKGGYGTDGSFGSGGGKQFCKQDLRFCLQNSLLTDRVEDSWFGPITASLTIKIELQN